MSQVISVRHLVVISLAAVLLGGTVNTPAAQWLLADDPVVTGGDVG